MRTQQREISLTDKGCKEETKMGIFDPKKRKIITAVIVIILVLAMVIPSILSILL